MKPHDKHEDRSFKIKWEITNQTLKHDCDLHTDHYEISALAGKKQQFGKSNFSVI